MSIFRKDIIENAVSERELCLMDPEYFIEHYVAVKLKNKRYSRDDIGGAVEELLIQLKINSTEYNEHIAKYLENVL